MLELGIVGMVVGLLSGFFGVGGGTVSIPLLLFMGYETKVAIGISVIQMVFSSLYGSYLNHKNGTLESTMVLYIGSGGFAGALLSGVISSYLSARTLEVIFFCFVLFALIRVFSKIHDYTTPQRSIHPALLVAIGFFLGAISMTIGVGGSILLVPILVGFFHIELKKAISAGLFFVVFSSVSGLISHAIAGDLEIVDGMIVGIASLVGVYFGIILKDRIEVGIQRKLLLLFYGVVLVYLAQRIFL